MLNSELKPILAKFRVASGKRCGVAPPQKSPPDIQVAGSQQKSGRTEEAA